MDGVQGVRLIFETISAVDIEEYIGAPLGYYYTFDARFNIEQFMNKRVYYDQDEFILNLKQPETNHENENMKYKSIFIIVSINIMGYDFSSEMGIYSMCWVN